ncbi:hypothetical protein J0910_04925 [Nocardiopsis sp. CNT-189]|uniref:hypothetical protein n=1 Tax=Nocardiopsis oceanisediminis TaxID=2816862 RepID=UPI003B2E177E
MKKSGRILGVLGAAVLAVTLTATPAEATIKTLYTRDDPSGGKAYWSSVNHRLSVYDIKKDGRSVVGRVYTSRGYVLGKVSVGGYGKSASKVIDVGSANTVKVEVCLTNSVSLKVSCSSTISYT